MEGMAEENNKYIDNAGVKQLELVTLEFKNSVYSKVFILEKGSLVSLLICLPIDILLSGEICTGR